MVVAPRQAALGPSPGCTTVPPTRVNAARPVSVRPANGVFRLFEKKVTGSTVHRAVTSSTTTSAGAPGLSEPPGSRSAAAGAVLIRAISSAAGRTPPSPSSVHATPHPVSEPAAPYGPSSNAAPLASYQWR